jgi:putative tricarboxylic transport membrane protein
MSRSVLNRDFVAGCILLVFSVIYYLAAAAIPASRLADSVGPGGMPKAYGVALGVLSILLIAQALLARRRAIAAAPDAEANVAARRDLHAALRAAVMLGIGVAYVILLPLIGYILSIALLIGATAWYQERARPRWVVPTAIIGAGALWIVFVEVLQIAQPAGFWSSLL